MGRQSKKSRIYWRERGGTKRAYADLRDYADVGGGREGLVALGEKLATADETTAQVLLARRLEQLDGVRRGRALHGETQQVTLADFAAKHLVAKAESQKFTKHWLEVTEKCLDRAVEFFGVERDLASITVADVRRWANRLLATSNGRKGTMSASSVRHHLSCFSNLYKRARAERVVPSGYDPVGDFDEKPSPRRGEAKWLELPDAALLLEAARTHRPAPGKGGWRPVPFAYELIATFLLTGGRESEVLGLEVDDVSLDRGVVTFRPNAWRRLKTTTSHRSVRSGRSSARPLSVTSPSTLRAVCCSRATARVKKRCSPTSGSCSMRWPSGRAGRRGRSAPRCSGTPIAPRGSKPWTRERR